jgi:hypothetical protein
MFVDGDRLIVAGRHGAALVSVPAQRVLHLVPYAWRSPAITAYQSDELIRIGTSTEERSISVQGQRLLVQEGPFSPITPFRPSSSTVVGGDFMARSTEAKMIEVSYQDNTALIPGTSNVSLAVHDSGLVALAFEDGRIRVVDIDSLRRGRSEGAGEFPFGYSGIAWLPNRADLLLGRATRPMLADPVSLRIQKVFGADGKWRDITPTIVASPSGRDSTGACYAPGISPDGRWFTYLKGNELTVWDQKQGISFRIRLKTEAWQAKAIFAGNDSVWVLDNDIHIVQRVVLSSKSVDLRVDGAMAEATALANWGNGVIVGYKAGDVELIDDVGVARWSKPLSTQITGLGSLGERLVVADKQGNIAILGMSLAVAKKDRPLARITSLAVTQDGRRFAVAGVDAASAAAANAEPEQVLGSEQLLVLDSNLKGVAAIPAGKDWFTELAFSGSGRYLAAITYAGMVKIVDLAPLDQSRTSLVSDLKKWTRVNLRDETDFFALPATRWGIGGARTMASTW